MKFATGQSLIKIVTPQPVRFARTPKAVFAAVAFCALVGVSSVTAGCGSPARQFIGRWSGPMGQMEFMPDGKCVTRTGFFNVEGTYEVRDNNTVRISTMGMAQDYKYEFENGKLDLTNPQGVISEMKPVQQ